MVDVDLSYKKGQCQMTKTGSYPSCTLTNDSSSLRPNPTFKTFCDKWFCTLIVLGHALSVLFATTATYVISVTNRGQQTFFPSISSTWQSAPESQIFGIILVFHCFLGILTVYIRYKHLSFISQTMITIGILNKAAFYIGITAMVFGTCTSYFPLNTYNSVHYTLAGIYMGAFGTYNLLQCIISVKMGSIPGCNKKLIWTRIVIIVLSLVTGISYGVIWPLHWNFDYLFGIGNGFQWFFCLTLIIFPITYTPEFRNLRVLLQLDYHL